LDDPVFTVFAGGGSGAGENLQKIKQLLTFITSLIATMASKDENNEGAGQLLDAFSLGL
jgi:hypothetical protein